MREDDHRPDGAEAPDGHDDHDDHDASDDPQALGPVESIDDAEGVEAMARALYGTSPASTGVVHVTSAWLRPGPPAGRLFVLDVGDADVPTSPFDAFALGLARARADAILTTGANLRREPSLRHVLDGPGALGRGLAAWRRERLAKDRPPVSLVLSSGRDLDLEHPLFDGPGRAVVLTDRQGAWRLESQAMDRGVEVVAHADPGPRAAIDFLRGAFGAATIVIEAGPSSARQLYDEPSAVDELMLTLYRAERLDAGRGPAFLPLDTLERRFARHARSPRLGPANGLEAAGHWELLRFVR